MAYAQQKLEELKNQPFTPGPFDNSDNPEVVEAEHTRSWTINQVAGTTAPNRLARINVTVIWSETGSTSPPQAVTLETMRAE